MQHVDSSSIETSRSNPCGKQFSDRDRVAVGTGSDVIGAHERFQEPHGSLQPFAEVMAVIPLIVGQKLKQLLIVMCFLLKGNFNLKYVFETRMLPG